jgi:hypothetical protein
MKRPYAEGSVFLVPLQVRGFARGIVARAPKTAGKVLLGYFFAPKVLSKGDATLNDIEPSKAILCVRFGDLGLINDTWPILGILPNWQRANWPVPDFVRRELLTERAYLKRFPPDLNRGDSQMVSKGGLFAH